MKRLFVIDLVQASVADAVGGVDGQFGFDFGSAVCKDQEDEQRRRIVKIEISGVSQIFKGLKSLLVIL